MNDLPESVRNTFAEKTFTAQWEAPAINPGFTSTWIGTVTVRWDDRHRNGRNTFSIVREKVESHHAHNRDHFAEGMSREEIEEHFPEIAPLERWHLVSANGPHGYPNDVLFFAGDRDCWGFRKGEPKREGLAIRF